MDEWIGLWGFYGRCRNAVHIHTYPGTYRLQHNTQQWPGPEESTKVRVGNPIFAKLKPGLERRPERSSQSAGDCDLRMSFGGTIDAARSNSTTGNSDTRDS